MTTQPEALRHADKLDAHEFDEPHGAAAELRRLHEAHDWQYKMAGERLRRIEKLEAQRDALLAALRKCSEQLTRLGYSANHADQAIAAIKAAEEGK